MLEGVDNLLDDFIIVSNLSGFTISKSEINNDLWKAPHKPKQLPEKYQAIYIFSLPLYENKVLKIGKAGPNTRARFLSQHYNANSSRSNLAKSLFKSSEFWLNHKFEKPEIDQIGNWIKINTDRNNFYISDKYNSQLLSLFEIFLQCKLSPSFEG